MVTWKLENLRVMIPGDFSIPGYCYLEITYLKKNFCEYLRENKNICENILDCEFRVSISLIHEKRPELENYMILSL